MRWPSRDERSGERAARSPRHARAVVLLGLALLIVGVVACGLAPGFASFLVVRPVMGIGAAAAFLAIFAELLKTAPAAWRGRLTNLFEGVAILSLGIADAPCGTAEVLQE